MNRKLIQTALAILVASLLLTAPRAQQTTAPPAAVDRVALYQALLDLTNPWTVMCIAAHPDDEDGTSLIVMRRKYGAHTVSLFSTFGEGGQNAIGPELYEELGAIRARETKAAAEIQGSEPYFLGLKDFGFSKSADEAFRFWGHEEALRRMVLEIRKLRPDVIITNHSVTNNDHGHHQATARLELEAFDAAADPNRFPEQLKDGVTVWQVQRLFVRARGTQSQTDNTPFVTIDPNERDPIRNATFAEEALSALQQHATQGPWPKTVAQMAARFTTSADGRLPVTRYRLALQAKTAAALPKEPTNFLDGLKLPEKTAKLIELPTIEGRPLVEFAADRPKVLASLVRGLRNGFYSYSEDKSDGSRLSWMRERLERALSLAAGVSLQAESGRRLAAPGATLELTVRLSNSGSENVTVQGCGASLGPVGGFLGGDAKLVAGSELRRVVKITIPQNAPVNTPLANHLYDPSEPGLLLSTRCLINLPNGYFNVESSTQIDVAPPVEISKISPSPLVIIPGTNNTARPLTLQVINHENKPRKTAIETVLEVNNPELKRTKLSDTPLTIGPEEQRTLTTTVATGSKWELTGDPVRRISLTSQQAPTPVPEASPLAAERKLLFRTSDKTSNEVVVPVVYADTRVAPNLRVGYVRGFDFSLPNALNALGVESKELSVDEVKTADLQKYTSIIVDNRVYESTPGLIAANQKLLDYAKAGGTLIVFYHKSFEWNPDPRRNRPDQLAPYKLILGDERITDENASITFLEPQHPLLNFPNKMGQEDFAGWIQERGLYYPKEWDPQFQALLQSNDPGETPLKGGLLAADYGRGKYIYTSMVWYRELRAGVPGAYRMLANMISYGRGK
jgi:LmbE family N-acetylglucosaminyl deacetylase